MDIQAEEPEDDFPINKPEKEDTSVSDESEGVTMVFEPTVSNPVPIVQEDSLEEAEPGFEVEPAASEEEYQGPELEPYNPTKDLENYRFPTIDLMKHFENDDPTIAWTSRMQIKTASSIHCAASESKSVRLKQPWDLR